MLSHTGSLGQYLWNFLLYTLTTIGLIYGVYWYSRKASGRAATPAPEAPVVTSESLVLESALSLEPQKTLYVVRSGSERFLISATGDQTQLMSKLEPDLAPAFAVPVTEEMLEPTPPRVDLPWYADQPVRMQAPPPVVRRKRGLGQHLWESIKLVVASRTK